MPPNRTNKRQTGYERKIVTRQIKPTILIVCEGKNTEPSYFRQFKRPTADIEVVGTGYNTLSLVKKANDLVLASKAKGRDYDQVWCVFDKDDFSQFDDEIVWAERNGLKVAYSNQAFEYWLLLHLDDHQGGKMSRKLYHDRLNTLLKPYGLTYDGTGTKMIEASLFDFLNEIDHKTNMRRRQQAINRAKRNLEHHDCPAGKAESSTTVYLLVAELEK
jgi:RloB-like protein